MTDNERELLGALKKSQQCIQQLASTVNNLSHRLGLGRKVRAEDFTEAADKAIAKYALQR
jgi:hypothetical protein